MELSVSLFCNQKRLTVKVSCPDAGLNNGGKNGSRRLLPTKTHKHSKTKDNRRKDNPWDRGKCVKS